MRVAQWPGAVLDQELTLEANNMGQKRRRWTFYPAQKDSKKANVGDVQAPTGFRTTALNAVIRLSYTFLVIYNTFYMFYVLTGKCCIHIDNNDFL